MLRIQVVVALVVLMLALVGSQALAATVDCFRGPSIVLLTFNDSDTDGLWDQGEVGISGLSVYAADPEGCSQEYESPVIVPAGVPEPGRSAKK